MLKLPNRSPDRYSLERRRVLAARAVRAGGALMVLGSILPWAWAPLAGSRVPIMGILGPGALTLAAGVWLVRRAPWWGAVTAGVFALMVAWLAWFSLPPAVNRTLIAFETRFQPMNDLLARFGIAPMSVFDTATPWREIRGPGAPWLALGGLAALAGAASAASARRGESSLRRCAGCGHRARPGRVTAYCVRCGAPMPSERACAVCHTLAEPGDLCCGVCGSGLGP